MSDLVNTLKAAGDSTRLRLLLALRHAELTVSELTGIVRQSQPRVSRHLKILCDAGLLHRFKEGSWVFYRAADDGIGAELTTLLMRWSADEKVHQGDMLRLSKAQEARTAKSVAFFKANAAEWEKIRTLHAPDKDVEEAIRRRLTTHPIENLLDAGTGTGRMLEMLAPYTNRAVGIDVSPEMLTIARNRLMRAEVAHCQVRLGDIYHLPFSAGTKTEGFDAILIHQVLHYLGDPQSAILSVAQVMRAGGQILIADFASHELEFLRDEYAHRRLGFSDREVQGWFKAARLRYLGAESVGPSEHSPGKLTVKLWSAARSNS
jgi:ArsR family transcriptional regulator